MGAEINLSEGMIRVKGNLKGTTINFEKSSVGATGNTLMAAVTADGTTIINNAAKEPPKMFQPFSCPIFCAKTTHLAKIFRSMLSRLNSFVFLPIFNKAASETNILDILR